MAQRFLEAVKSAGQIVLGVAVLAVIIGISAVCAFGEREVLDRSPDWAYPFLSSFLENDDDFITFGYTRQECSSTSSAFNDAAERADANALLLLDDYRRNCSRQYSDQLDDSLEYARVAGLTRETVDCGFGMSYLREILDSREPGTISALGMVLDEYCPTEYRRLISDIR